MKVLVGEDPRAAYRLRGVLLVAVVISVLSVLTLSAGPARAHPVPGGSLDLSKVPKYVEPLVIPPAMPRTQVLTQGGKKIDYYEIAVKQFQQYILPKAWSQSQGIGPTTVWSYASMTDPRPVAEGGTLNYPGFTIEARRNRPVRVKWINGLVDAQGNYLPHLFAVDQTLHWANPPGGPGGTDSHGMDGMPYTGPVPIVTHVHGAHTTEDSDGFPEAWYLPAAKDIPAGYATEGTYYQQFKAEAEARTGQVWEPGSAVFQYANDQRPATLWYHDHSLGMTRLNVYAGPAGFYLVRGDSDKVAKRLPRPAPQRGDKPGTRYHEIPIVIQDRSFNADGSLFYPDNRAFFEGLNVPGQPQQFPGAPELRIPFTPDTALDGQMSDISPQWNPEFFGNTMVVNGKTWPYLKVEQRRYRFRLLNGTESRFLILKMSNGMPFTQIGSEGGYLPRPVKQRQLLIAPAERADVIVDFTRVPRGTKIVLRNVGPDEPFGGDPDAEPADARTTGQVMQFRVRVASGPDTSATPDKLRLPAIDRLPKASVVRNVSLNELSSSTVKAAEDEQQNVVLDPNGEPFAPREAALGTWTAQGGPQPLMWMDGVTENPDVGALEAWNIRNFTMDAHPIHIHLVQFQVVKRVVTDPMMSPHGMKGPGATMKPEPWEMGWKDTVIVYPGELTQVKARFDTAGLFVWHCHILEHEDNEMMRPYRVGPAPAAMLSRVTTTPAGSSSTQ
jgi:FtsP/CotA-like multicopper oxidase with cupredoxin domain